MNSDHTLRNAKLGSLKHTLIYTSGTIVKVKPTLHIHTCEHLGFMMQYGDLDLKLMVFVDALTEKAAALSLEAQSKLSADVEKRERKAEAKAEAEAKRMQAAKVTIKRIERNKKKFVTAIHGLEAFGKLFLISFIQDADHRLGCASHILFIRPRLYFLISHTLRYRSQEGLKAICDQVRNRCFSI